MNRIILFCLKNKLVVLLLTGFLMVWGYIHAPFDWSFLRESRDPVPVDAIPDIGENQQIVFAEWMGRSPQDIENQITYPLTTSLLGVPRVKTIRSISMSGFSMIFIIFDDDAEFYWSRTRILEKLNSLPSGLLPDGVQPSLGPDATALGQVFWYTLEGRDAQGNPAGGWDLQELRSIQDFTVKYALQSAAGVSEVASIGGFVKEYQVNIDPDDMRLHGVSLMEVIDAVRGSNLDVGASVMEINQVEYSIRGVGYIKTAADLENAVIKQVAGTPVYLHQVADIVIGPQFRRGALDKGGTEAVGGVVVVRYGENPLAAIKEVKRKIEEISLALPSRSLADGSVSKVTIVPFYDRTTLINETLGTLNQALYEQIIITSIVVLIMVRHFASSVIISLTMPFAVMGCFIAMRLTGIDANLVSLAGIAIAIGTIVDMGIIVCENILQHMDRAQREAGEDARLTRQQRLDTIFAAVSEVSGAVVTAISTTIISFLAVFTMEAAEGKLFKPLAYTKTFVLFASVVVALTIIPALAHLFFGRTRKKTGATGNGIGAYLLAGFFVILLARSWMPLGADRGIMLNTFAVFLITGSVFGVILLYQSRYPAILSWCLANKKKFLAIPSSLIFMGLLVWLGVPRLSAWLPSGLRDSAPLQMLSNTFPGLGREFMPPLDEGSFLFMPSAMPHAGLNEVLDLMQQQDMGFAAIPEIEEAVGKLGRAESALDPAPVGMIETVINYKTEFLSDPDGRRLNFRYDSGARDVFRDAQGNPLPGPDGEPYTVQGRFERDPDGRLIPDRNGHPFRQWRVALDPELNSGREAWAGIRSPEDIWAEILKAGEVPGLTSAPWLQPISARIVMLQSGMRAPMGIKVRGPSLDAIEAAGLLIEKALKEVPQINPATVVADRIVGKPYLEIHPDRIALARYGIKVTDFQDVLEVAVGGKIFSRTVEGRERYPVRIQANRDSRGSIESLGRILIPVMDKAHIPLRELADIRYVRGPEMIKGENTSLLGYVLFDKHPGYAEVDVVDSARETLAAKLANGTLALPEGISYTFAGSYENQIRASRKLALVIPLSLFIIFLILYAEFRRIPVTLFVFTAIFVTWSGGFVMIWFYNQPWFLDFHLLDVSLRELFSVHGMNLSVAVWVGFLALFGLATDDAVVICSYLDQRFKNATLSSISDIRGAVVDAGRRRIRPCMMTTATTLLALIPVLSATGRGADLMIPMAIPSFGGMVFEMMTSLVSPVLYSWWQERRLSCTSNEHP